MGEEGKKRMGNLTTEGKELMSRERSGQNMKQEGKRKGRREGQGIAENRKFND